MRRMISIVDLATGSVSQRPSDTPTLDLPEDFDRETRVAALDTHSHAHYAGTNGASTSRAVHARPLSWRVHGETCLVATGSRAATASQRSNYKLCAIEPERS
jgi:hypothetical protein